MNWEDLIKWQTEEETEADAREWFTDPETGEVVLVWQGPAFEEGPEDDLWF